MGLFNKSKEIKELQEQLTELKSYIDIASQDNYSYASVWGLSANTLVSVTPRMSYLLSEKNSDLGKAVGDISASLAALVKGVKNGNDEIDYNHPLIQTLNRPGGGSNKLQFFKEVAESFLLQQEAYIVARGNITRPALELVFIRPYDVNIIMDDTTGEPSAIYTTCSKDRRQYTKQILNGRTRYIDNSGLNELLCIRGTVSLTDEWRGRSPLSKLYYDIILSTEGKKHNTSMLQNGMKTSGIMSPKPQTGDASVNWSEPRVKQIEQYIRTFGQGAGNAGNVLIVGTPLEVQGLTQSNKDMDFAVLLEKSQIAIFNMYNFPLPLVLSANMSYNNFTTANRTYYTKAVFPVFDQIAEGLLYNLRERYGLTDTDTLIFDDTAIRDLQPVMIENMKMLNDTQAVSTNEVRRLGGYEDIEGGDEIFIIANKLPLSSMSIADPDMFKDPSAPDVNKEDDTEDDTDENEEMN